MHLFNQLSKDSENINNKIYCSYCYKPFYDKLWCKRCDPRRMIEGWSSGNPDIDNFIKDTIYNVRNDYFSTFLEWVPFDKITDIKQISEGEFSKVYSAIWMDGKSSYKNRNDGSWERLNNEPIKVALKKLNGSQKMSNNYLNKVLYILLMDIRFLYYYYLLITFIIENKNRLKNIGIFIQIILIF
jgi:hypothetical protein